MTPYLQALFALLVALGAHAVAAGLALEVYLRKELVWAQRRGWLALACGGLLFALQQGYALELALTVGIYDLRAAVQGAAAAVCLAFAVMVFRPAAA